MEDLEVQVDFDFDNHLNLDCSNTHHCNPLVFDCHNNSFHDIHHTGNRHIVNDTMILEKEEIIKWRNLFFP